MRQFKLINRLGQEFDLMRKDAWLHDPTGLGFGRDASVQRVGNTFALLDSDESQPSPTGEMMFAGYEQADEFRHFVASGGIILAYKPRETWRYLDVVVSMDQGELDTATKLLRCMVTFTGTSHWYESVVAYKAQRPSVAAGKVYPYIYSYTYVQTETGTVQIHNGALPSYPRLVIFGPVLNPAWALYQGGVQLADGKVSRRIDAEHKLVIDCNPATMEIGEYTLDDVFTADRYGDSDFSTARFFTVPPGESMVSFAQDETAAITAWVEVNRRV